jgi:hypothetical protein
MWNLKPLVCLTLLSRESSQQLKYVHILDSSLSIIAQKDRTQWGSCRQKLHRGQAQLALLLWNRTALRSQNRKERALGRARLPDVTQWFSKFLVSELLHIP